MLHQSPIRRRVLQPETKIPPRRLQHAGRIGIKPARPPRHRARLTHLHLRRQRDLGEPVAIPVDRSHHRHLAPLPRLQPPATRERPFRVNRQ